MMQPETETIAERLARARRLDHVATAYRHRLDVSEDDLYFLFAEAWAQGYENVAERVAFSISQLESLA